MRNHDHLIDNLSQTARPVARVWPTGWRVAAWVSLVLPSGALSSWALHSHLTDWSEPSAIPAMLALVLSFIVAISTITAAFTLSIAGRRPFNQKGALLLAMLWLAINVLNMSPSLPPAGASRFGEGIHCYLFMLSASLPMMVITILSLHRTRALYPAQSLALSGCAIAFMSSLLLSLCHDTHLHMLDFTLHLAAGITIVALTVLLGRRWVRQDR